MKKITLSRFSFVLTLCILLFSIPIISIASTASSSPESIAKANREIAEKMSGLRIPFIENQGQVSEEVGFYAKTFGGTLYVTKRGDVVYYLQRISKASSQDDVDEAPDQSIVEIWALKESLVGAKVIQVTGMDRAVTKANYFIGNDRTNWKTNIATFSSISLGRIYNGIDLDLKAYGNNVEKVFTVHPSGSVSDIRLKIDGMFSLKVNCDGELEIGTGLGSVRFSAPIAFQEIDGNYKSIKVSYVVSGKTYGFRTGVYNSNHPLIIDPLLASTFIEGTSNDEGYSIALDDSNNVYVTGKTDSNDYPATSGAYGESNTGSTEVFISKLTADLSTLLASTFIGGTGSENGYSIAIDNSDNVYVTGYTDSTDYSTTSGAYKETYTEGGSVFVSKLTSNLAMLSASTYIGGSLVDLGRSIALDGSNNVYLTGYTNSNDFPVTSGAYDESHAGSKEVFVSKFNTDLTDLTESTFIGGSSNDEVHSIALDGADNVYVTGYTLSADYPTTSGAYDETHNGNISVIISKLTSNLATLSASTFIEGSLNDVGISIALDDSSNVYVTGYTDSIDFPVTSGAYDEVHNGTNDVFVSKLTADLTSLSASTFIGGSESEFGNSIALDGSSNVYVTGKTDSNDYPVTSWAYDQIYSDLTDVFVSNLNSNLTELSASTFIGGTRLDRANSIAIDSSDNVYVTGATYSSEYPTTSGAYDETFNGSASTSVFVSKLSANLERDGITITVTNTNDSGAGSLRQAIADAQSGDTIQFDPAVNAITLASELVLDDLGQLTILGPGTENLTISGDNNSRIFSLTNSTMAISGLTLANGKAPDGATGFSGEDGGAIYVDANSSLVLIACVLKNNTAANYLKALRK